MCSSESVPIKAVLWCLGAAATCLAQDAAPLRLTLQDAVRLALRENPQVLLANLRVAQSQQEQSLARSSLLPQANVNISELVHRVNLESAIGFRFPNFPQHVGPYEVFQAGTGFSAPLFDLTLWRRYRESFFAVEASRAQENTMREENVLLVVSQYLGSQRSAADLEAAQSRVDLARALYEQAADLQRNGVGTGIDTLRANVELQNERQRLIVARTGLETSLYGLVRLLNLRPQQRVELADSMTFTETPEPEPADALARAFAARPELRDIENRQRRAELELRAAGEDRLPKFSVAGSWFEQGLGVTSAIPVYQYQFGVDFPLFAGGRIQAQRATADLELRQIRQQEQDIRNRIALEVKTSLAQLESARSEVDTANLGVQLANQEVEQARDRFNAGVTNNIEVITAQDALARANDNQIEALYRYNQARAGLARATGRMEILYAQ
jgi:outer membrane protein TolC